MIKVSVVVATYRQDESLKRALRSLAEQTYENVEIVLVNDNANTEWNEKVLAIVDEFKREFPVTQINYIVNDPNQGSAKTRNIGIAASSGEYVTFLDDDDVYLPEKVKRQVEFMIDGGLDFSVTDLELYNDNGKLIDRRIRSYVKDTSPASLQLYHLKHHITGTDTMMFTREYLTGIGGFAHIDSGDEYYLMQRAIDGKGKFGYLPGCDIKAYVHTGEQGLSCGEGKIKGENALYEYKKQYFSNVSAKDRRYIKMRHYAVLAFAYIRMKRYWSFFKSGIHAFFCSPLGCISLLLKK